MDRHRHSQALLPGLVVRHASVVQRLACCKTLSIVAWECALQFAGIFSPYIFEFCERAALCSKSVRVSLVLAQEMRFKSKGMLVLIQNLNSVHFGGSQWPSWRKIRCRWIETSSCARPEWQPRLSRDAAQSQSEHRRVVVWRVSVLSRGYVSSHSRIVHSLLT